MDGSYLAKQIIFLYFLISCIKPEHTFFLLGLIKVKKNCWYLFYSLTRQTNRQIDSPLF